MKAKSKLLVVPLLLSFGALFLVWQWVSAIPESAMHTAVHQPNPAALIDPALLSAIADGPPDQQLRFILYLSAKADLSNWSDNLSTGGRHAELVTRLQTTAVTSQAPLIAELETAKQTGTIQTYRPLWIVNAIAVSGTAVAIQTLATRPEIAEIRLDAVVDSFQPPEENQLLTLLQEGELGNGPIRSWGIERIQAPHVWHGLGIDGTGVTVGIMDTGVDFLHPDLVNSYRGNLGNGSFEHTGNWYNANIPGNTVPYDNYGHGTHVAGTAVGANGIGVAPGAQWIAVNIAAQGGYIFTSDAHAGFQWLLAPNNDPAAAPDVVNASWSGPGYSQEFLPDVVALQTSGIIPVFAAGNAGPYTGTIGAPASFPGTLAVGASDDIDGVAWFSSLGPSPLTEEVKPWVVAPGTQILSALPGNMYGTYNGTSMSAPHTVGTIALLLSANPTLSEAQIKQTLADTAVPISPVHPNMVSGWGRLNAYTAVQTQVTTGRLRGTIFADGLPLPHTAITITTASGVPLAYQSDGTGQYEAALRPGSYTITISLFGYGVYQSAQLTVQANQITGHNIPLTRLPGGTVTGVVRDANSQLPLANAIVQLDGQSLQTTTDNDGRYTLILPAGTHNLTVRMHAYRLGRANINLNIGQTRTQNFSLAPGPTVLLIDSGQWYYRSEAAYYQGSMTALGYPVDTWPIRHPLNDVPADTDLADYDAVIWSAPEDSPGYLDANNVITNYLGIGGNVLLSGQNVGAFDGQGFYTQLYWHRYLGADYLEKTGVTHIIQGAENSPFAGLSLTLNGGSSANNQASPDVSQPVRDSMTRNAFAFEDGRAAGLLSGHCQPGRMVYTGFGLEGVTDSADRQAILQRSLDYFATPLTSVGVRFLPAQVNDFAVPGDHMVYTLTVQNLSETLTDTFSITAVNEGWPTSLLTTTVTLGPCDAGHTVLNLDIPPNLPKNTYHTVRVTAVSGNNPAASNVSLIHHKTPGQILFVDDDRWYDEERHLTNALDTMGLEYDVWETGWKEYDRRNSPPTHLLHEYDFIIWYTGYDWFAPVRPNEAESLAEYLAQGGRLFLTSQDFLYYNADTELARHYLGIMDYRESVTPTLVFGGNHQAIADNLAGPLALNRGRYHNNGDGLIPRPSSQPFFWHDSGMPAGISTAGSTWRSVFWGIPFETLPDEAEAAAMNHIIGWLSDLGDSAFEVDERVDTAQSSFGFAVATRTYTITLQNTPLAPENQIWMFNNLPDELRLVPDSLTGGATYHPAGWLTWQGTLPSGGRHQIVYQAVPIQPLPPGTAVTSTLSIYYNRHDLAFERTAVYWADAPDLSDSTFTAVPNQPQAANQIAYLLTLRNTGLAAANAITTNMRLPDDLTVLSSTLLATGGTTWADGRRVFWQGSLLPGQSVIIRIIATREDSWKELWLPATAVIQDGVTSTLLKEQILYLPPYKQHLPIIVRN